MTDFEAIRAANIKVIFSLLFTDILSKLPNFFEGEQRAPHFIGTRRATRTPQVQTESEKRACKSQETQGERVC
jgi:hypothetical protein